MKYVLLCVLSFVCAVVFICSVCFAGDVKFGWDPYTDTANGFKLYCGRTSPVATSTANLQATITPTTVVTYTKALATGNWYCAMTAYDSNTESAKSNEISVLVPLSPPSNLKTLAQVIAMLQGGLK